VGQELKAEGIQVRWCDLEGSGGLLGLRDVGSRWMWRQA
jgi:hypothetical protein